MYSFTQLLINIFPILLCFLMSSFHCEYFLIMDNEGNRLQTEHEFKTEETNNWKQPRELIKPLYSMAKNRNFCSPFSSFVCFENSTTQINRWCRYDFDDEISYSIHTNTYNRIDINGFNSTYDWLLDTYDYDGKLLAKYFINFHEDYILSSPISVISSLNMFNQVIKRLKISQANDSTIFGISDVIHLGGNTPDVIPKVLLSFEKIRLSALIDSGCSHVLMNETQYEKIRAQYSNSTLNEINIQGLGKRFALATGKSHPKINRISILNFSFTSQKAPQSIYRIKVLVTRDLNFPIIIGRSLQRDLSMIINMENNFISVKNPRTNKRADIPFCGTKNTQINCETAM